MDWPIRAQVVFGTLFFFLSALLMYGLVHVWLPLPVTRGHVLASSSFFLVGQSTHRSYYRSFYF